MVKGHLTSTLAFIKPWEEGGGGGGGPLQPSSQSSRFPSTVNTNTELLEIYKDNCSTGTSVDQEQPVSRHVEECHNSDNDQHQEEQHSHHPSSDHDYAPSTTPIDPYDEVLKRQHDLEERERIQRQTAVRRYMETGNAEVFKPILQPFTQNDQKTWTWVRETERWYCESSQIWCPTLDSFS